jgi:hypothetical protein
LLNSLGAVKVLIFEDNEYINLWIISILLSQNLNEEKKTYKMIRGWAYNKKVKLLSMLNCLFKSKWSHFFLAN